MSLNIGNNTKTNYLGIISHKGIFNTCLNFYQSLSIKLFIFILLTTISFQKGAISAPKKAEIKNSKCKATEGSECLISTKEAFKLFKPLLTKNFSSETQVIKLIDDQGNCEKNAEVFPQTSAFYSSCSLVLLVKHNKKKHKMFCTLEYNLNQGSLGLKLCSFEGDESDELLESLLVEGAYSTKTMNDMMISDYRKPLENFPIQKESIIFK